jgi:hypothetical protein
MNVQGIKQKLFDIFFLSQKSHSNISIILYCWKSVPQVILFSRNYALDFELWSFLGQQNEVQCSLSMLDQHRPKLSDSSISHSSLSGVAETVGDTYFQAQKVSIVNVVLCCCCCLAVLVFETGICYTAQTDLKLLILFLSLPSARIWGMNVLVEYRCIVTHNIFNLH